jgi:hypothetical protein
VQRPGQTRASLPMLCFVDDGVGFTHDQARLLFSGERPRFNPPRGEMLLVPAKFVLNLFFLSSSFFFS